MPLHDAPRDAPPAGRGRETLDFSDYLQLRRRRDRGEPGLDPLLAWLEERLPVPFARAIPHLATLADAPEPPPRDLTREALRVVFAMREELARHGAVRSGLAIDLPEGRGLKPWLDFMETERRLARRVREHLRELDGKIWAMMAGSRRMPAPVRAPPESGMGATDRQGLYERQMG